MSLLEYAKRVSPVPLSDWQKKFLEAYEQAEKEDKQLTVCFPARAGRGMLIAIIQMWKMK